MSDKLRSQMGSRILVDEFRYLAGEDGTQENTLLRGLNAENARKIDSISIGVLSLGFVTWLAEMPIPTRNRYAD